MSERGNRFGLDAQIACVEREISIREKVYKVWVEKRKMAQQSSDHELGAMRAVLKTLKAVQQGGGL